MAGGGKPEGVPEGIAVHALGHIKDPILMAKVYASADLFVIPSLQDNLPNTILESLSCGTPVVGFNSGGITEIINDDRLGHLATEKSETALARAIILGLNGKFDRSYIRSVAIERYRLGRQARDYAALYEDILK